MYLITGCSHAGISTLLEKAIEYTTENYGSLLFVVIGGLHLIQFPKYNLGFLRQNEIDYLVTQTRRGVISHLYVNHYTSQRAYKKLKQKLGMPSLTFAPVSGHLDFYTYTIYNVDTKRCKNECSRTSSIKKPLLSGNLRRGFPILI